MKFDVIVLAGGKGIKGSLTFFTPKALVKINNKHMIEYVTDAFLEVENLKNIIVVGDKKELDKIFNKIEKITVLQQEGSMLGNINKAIKFLEITEGRVLIATSDIPLITKQSIEDFIELCKDFQYDFYLPLVNMEDYQKKFSSTKRTWLYLKEGVFTTGNICMINPNVFLKESKRINQIFENRKSPFKIINMIGIIFLLKFIFRMLSVKEVEKKVKKISGFDAKAIYIKYPEISFDVDKASDLEFIKKYLTNR